MTKSILFRDSEIRKKTKRSTLFLFASILLIVPGLFGTNEAKAANEFTVTASVGTASASYNTLQLAFAAINNGTHQGTITITVSASVTDNNQAVINASGSGSASYTSITVYPTNTGVTLSGSNAVGLISFNGADNVTINGSKNQGNSSNDLTISNTNTSGVALYFSNSAENNTIEYCIVKGINTVSPGIGAYSGIICFGGATSGNGNDGNIIDHCNITSGASRPYYGITSYGNTTSGRENGSITISNNNFYNLFSNAASSDNIFISEGTISASITGNSFYETTTLAPTGAYSYSMLHIEQTTSVCASTITSNYIGGKAASCGSTAFTSSCSFNTTFYGIKVTNGATTCDGNTLRNIAWTHNSTSTSLFYGIYISGTGNHNVGATTGNTIGSISSTGSITVTNNAGTASSVFSGIYCTGDIVSGAGTISISNNNIGGITSVGNTSGYGYNVYGIFLNGSNSSSNTITVSSNTIGSLSQANSINASSTTTNTQLVSGIYSTIYSPVTMNGNQIANLTNATTFADVNSITGIRVYGSSSIGSQTISNNTIYTLSTASGSTPSSSYNSTAAGILYYNKTASTVGTISGNIVHDITSTSTAATWVTGIALFGVAGQTHSVSKNFVYDIKSSSTNTSGLIAGIIIDAANITAGGPAIVDNNVINIGSAITTSTPQICGIYNIGATGVTQTYYFNTIYLANPSGGSTTGTTPSAAFADYNVYTIVIKNNLFVNSRSNNGASGPHYAISTGAFNPVVTGSNYNQYWISGTGGVLGNYNNNATPASTIALWRAQSGCDANSINSNPNFTNAGGTSATDYVPTSASTGIAAGGITTDYSGTTRTYPRIGAFEHSCPRITSQPSAGGICYAGTYSPSISITGGVSPTYQWKYSANNSTFNNVANGTPTNASYSNSTTSNLSASGNIAAGSSYYYECVVSDAGCTTLTSNSAQLTITAAPNAGTLSGTTPICAAGTTTFSSNGDAGGSWTSGSTGIATVVAGTGVISGVSTGTSTITYTVTGNGGCSNATATKTVTIDAVPSITVQPGAGNICVGGTYSPSITATGGTSLTYQWKYCTTSGGSYNNVANSTPSNATYSNATSNTLSVSGNIAAGSGYYYKCLVSDAGSGCSSVTSSYGQLTVNAVPSISVQPTSSSISIGGTYSPSITATGGTSLTYQWKYSSDNGSYSNVSSNTPSNSTYSNGTTNNMSVTGSIGAGTYYYKCVISDAGSGCSSVTSNAGVLTVVTPIYYSKSSGNLEITSTWGTNTDGSGVAPTDFIENGQTFNIRNNSSPTIGAAWTVSGTSSNVILGNSAVTAINFTVPSSFAFVGPIDIAAASSGTNTLTISNTTIPTFGTIDGTSTVNYAAANTQTITAISYGNLIISGGGSNTKTLASGTTGVTGNLTINAFTTLASGNNTLNITGNLSNSGTLSVAAGTVNLTGTYSGAGTTTISSGTMVTNNTFDATGGAITFSGSGNLKLGGATISSLGTFTKSTGTVHYNRAGTQTILSAPTYNNLTIAGSGTKTLDGATTVESTLTLTAGYLATGANTLTLGTTSTNATISGGNSSSYIIAYDNTSTIGYVKQYINSNATYTYPIGDATHYTPMVFKLNSNGGLSSAYLTVYTKASKIPGLNSALTTYLNRFWDYVPTGITSANYDLTLNYDNADINGTEASLLPIKKSGSTWYAPSTTSLTGVTKQGTGSVNTTTKSLLWTSLTTFSTASGAGDASTLLPVELIALETSCEENNTKLQWSTASETNNDYFALEKSNDLIHFKEIDRIKGAGNSNEVLNYNYIDKNTNNFEIYYRIKQVDFDGKYEYFNNVVSKCNEDKNDEIQIFYNAENKEIISTIKANKAEKFMLYIYDKLGRLIISEQLNTNIGTTEFHNNIYIYAVGVYSVIIIGESSSFQKKLILN